MRLQTYVATALPVAADAASSCRCPRFATPPLSRQFSVVTFRHSLFTPLLHVEISMVGFPFESTMILESTKIPR
jgi:hypothetical protein